MSDGYGNYFGWAPRKSVARRRADATRLVNDARRRGKPMSPVTISGRKIAHTFWGKAWCDNLERYRDFAHRLERGRSYVRSGSVLDLSIDVGTIAATVSGSDIYRVAITIDAVTSAAWRAIQTDCAGRIGSRLDLLGGRLSDAVMARLCADRTGLFPPPSAIRFTCSCPDYAIMCKHVAAAMYGVGARLDHAPELLFGLRSVSLDDLVASAATQVPDVASERVLVTDELGALFGIELAGASEPAPALKATTRKPGVRKKAIPKVAAKPPAPATRTRDLPKPRRKRGTKTAARSRRSPR